MYTEQTPFTHTPTSTTVFSIFEKLLLIIKIFILITLLAAKLRRQFEHS